ncbi:hypothetical protein DPEC_G00252690 [Dallia pectoralis]|uniref:Uncharacterized protein n=1 Tax=Dallia pectoralis TaxID=75939 RepID=A0ACC2FTH2_DALPE|nr:hypothetical protein DPEC_G00252690 [Dallia pectoralis]
MSALCTTISLLLSLHTFASTQEEKGQSETKGEMAGRIEAGQTEKGASAALLILLPSQLKQPQPFHEGRVTARLPLPLDPSPPSGLPCPWQAGLGG